jgi:opacity protein-like surface antigen
MRRVLVFVLLIFCALAPVQHSLAGVGFGIQGNVTNFKIGGDLARITGLGAPSSNTTSLALQEVYGLGVGGGIHFDIGLPFLSFRVSGDYLTLSPDNTKFQTFVRTYVGLPGATVAVDGGRITMLSGNVNLKLNILPIPVFKPYITGGAGMANVKADDLSISVGALKVTGFQLIQTQTVTTFNLGAGIDLDFVGLVIFGEVKVNWVMLKEGSSVEVPIATVGLTF